MIINDTKLIITIKMGLDKSSSSLTLKGISEAEFLPRSGCLLSAPSVRLLCSTPGPKGHGGPPFALFPAQPSSALAVETVDKVDKPFMGTTLAGPKARPPLGGGGL